MKFIPLTIKLPEDVKEFERVETIIKDEILSFFTEHGYHREIMRDKSTSYEKHANEIYAVYVFEMNKHVNVPEKELSLDEVKDFFKNRNLEYRLELF